MAKREKPGDIVSMDNLPPSGPDLNPIEIAFAKLKAHLRRAGALTIEETLDALIVVQASSANQKISRTPPSTAPATPWDHIHCEHSGH